MSKSTTCPTCHGTKLYGYVYGQHMPCPTCNGTGDIPAQSNNDPVTAPAPGEVAAKPIATMDIYDGGVAKPRKGLLDDEVAAEQPEPCSGCLGITVHHTCGKQPDAYATPPTDQPCKTHGMYGECPGHPGPYDPPMEARELDTYFSPQAEILSRAYDLGHHNKLDGCLVPLLEQLDALITSEANRLAGEMALQARRDELEGLILKFQAGEIIGGAYAIDVVVATLRDRLAALSAYTKGVDKTQ